MPPPPGLVPPLPAPLQSLPKAALLPKKEASTEREPSGKLQFSAPNVFYLRLQLWLKYSISSFLPTSTHPAAAMSRASIVSK